MNRLTHLNDQGEAAMVDVSNKPETSRTAVASAIVTMKPATLKLIQENGMAKGDVLAVARVAGIMGAKQTSQLIPLCHPLNICKVTIDFVFVDSNTIRIDSLVKVVGQTGVEMEALTAVSIAALTIYDMCKAVDREMVLGPIQLEQKSGGKSGEFVRGSGADGKEVDGKEVDESYGR